MPDIQRLIDQLNTDGDIQRLARNRAIQFGTRTRRLLGAEILPAVNQEENRYVDDTVRYRTVVGNAGTRYSPVVIKGGALVGSVEVNLFEMDLGSELTAREYDALIRYLDRNLSMEASAQVMDFLNRTVNMGLEELREVYRWQAIQNAVVNRRGANGYREDVQYSNPEGHRAAAAAAWSNDANDPFDDIFAMAQVLTDKGFAVGRIVSTRQVVNIMGLNEKVRTRTGTVRVNAANGQFTTSGGGASLAQINAALAGEGLPEITIYDEIYRTQTGTRRFIDPDVMIMIGRTGRDETVVLDEADPDSNELLPDTLGYYGVGRAAGQSEPGRVLQMVHKTDKPPRIEAQGWETSAPVITEPEAVAVIQDIA